MGIGRAEELNQGTRRVTVPGSDGATPVAEAIAVEATEDEINGNQINGEDAAAAGWQPLVPAGPGFAGARRLCRDAVRRLGVRGAAVTVRGGRNQELLHATDQVIARLDDLQIVVGEGPGRDAFEFRVPVLEPDLDSQNGMARWPVFGREATAVGAAAVFAFPLQAGAVPFGVLQLYRPVPGRLTAAQLADALLLVDQGGPMVLTDLDGADLTPTAGNPEPMFGRDEIPVATGMIAVQLGVTVDQALTELRAAAFTTGRPITDVAADVLARRITFHPPEPPTTARPERPPTTPSGPA